MTSKGANLTFHDNTYGQPQDLGNKRLNNCEIAGLFLDRWLNNCGILQEMAQREDLHDYPYRFAETKV
jgi:hypothetical protein